MAIIGALCPVGRTPPGEPGDALRKRIVAEHVHVGPQAVAFAVLLNKRFGVPYGKIAALFRDRFHLTLDATNWRAEHALRPAVVTRKMCGGGNRTRRGAG